MKDLKKFLEIEKFIEIQISFSNNKWLDELTRGLGPGWYFISTDTPLEVMQCAVPLPPPTPGKLNRNYNIAERAIRFDARIENIISKNAVYSGYAWSIKARTREHFQPNMQTGALGLSNYKTLHKYNWSFNYRPLSEYDQDLIGGSAQIVLKLGEQIWRAEYGWPILCSR